MISQRKVLIMIAEVTASSDKTGSNEPDLNAIYPSRPTISPFTVTLAGLSWLLNALLSKLVILSTHIFFRVRRLVRPTNKLGRW